MKSFKDLKALPPAVPGPCDPEDLIDGIIFAANYLGSTQLLSDKTPSKNIRMMQAQEAVSRIKVNAQQQLLRVCSELFLSQSLLQFLTAHKLFSKTSCLILTRVVGFFFSNCIRKPARTHTHTNAYSEQIQPQL